MLDPLLPRHEGGKSVLLPVGIRDLESLQAVLVSQEQRDAQISSHRFLNDERAENIPRNLVFLWGG